MQSQPAAPSIDICRQARASRHGGLAAGSLGSVRMLRFAALVGFWREQWAGTSRSGLGNIPSNVSRRKGSCMVLSLLPRDPHEMGSLRRSAAFGLTHVRG